MIAPRRVVCLLAIPLAAPATPAQGPGPWSAVEEAKLIAGDADMWDEFGSAVAFSGDTALIGSKDDNGIATDTGAAYVFLRNGSTWIQQQKLSPSDAASGDQFGWSIAISGDTAVVGSPFDDHAALQAGAAYVFVRKGTTWIEQQRLTASDPQYLENFGWSVGISGDTIVVGAWRDDPGDIAEAGSAYVFVRSGTAWTEQAKLVASDAAPYDGFGISVAVSGDTILVGAFGDDTAAGVNTGSAYLFERQGAAWNEVQNLVASDPGSSDDFGERVALSSDTAVVGADRDDHSGAANAGSAYVFVRGSGMWIEQQKLTASDPTEYGNFGSGVGLSGDAIAAGAPGGEAAYVFLRSGTSWSELIKLAASDGQPFDAFGAATAISGDSVVVGAPGDDLTSSNSYEGSAYAFRVLPAPPTSYCTAGTSASGCQALLSASGTPSASAASGFTLQAAAVEGQKDGLFFFGTNGGQANPWGNGTSYQCVVPPVIRAGLLSGSGTNGACDGSFSQDLNALWCPTCPKPQKNPGAGAVVQAQLWYRDPQSTSNQPTSLSDALEFLVGL